MSFAYTRVISTAGPFTLIEIIPISPDSTVPPRPTPGPTPPEAGGGEGIWGPTDPRPSNPIQLPPWAGKPQPPFPGQPPTTGGEQTKVLAVVSQLPEGVTPPAAPPADAKTMTVWFGPGTLPTVAWVAPYASTGPVEPPSTATPV